MSYGLLAGAFRPAGEICAVRAVMRQRTMLLRMQAHHVQHMQKALTQMNIQLTNVISDIVGQTGQRIIRAILAGERDGHRLAKLRDFRIKASEGEIARALVGTWREEHLFALGQAVALFDSYAVQIAACDRKLDALLAALATRDGNPGPDKRKGHRQKNAPDFDARTRLYRLTGVDLTRIDGIDASTALKVVSEIGPDLSRFKTSKRFASWLKLCPGTRISGGKVLSARTGRSGNQAAQALRLAASALRNSQSALGAYYRRLASRLDTPAVITAVAHKLARLVYTMLTRGAEYVDKGVAFEEARHRERQLRSLALKARALGFDLAPRLAPRPVS
jgi:transposase